MGVITRPMGLSLAVIGTQMVIDGVLAVRPLANA
jgi:small neutral amino acid transporter SnatA (MarC family)